MPTPCLGCGRPGPGKAGAARPEDGGGAGARRHGGVRTGGASCLAKRGLRRTTPGSDRAKPRQGGGTRLADTEEGMGASAMAHAPIARAAPGRVRMRLARAARLTLVQPAVGAHDPRWPSITGCQVVRR